MSVLWNGATRLGLVSRLQAANRRRYPNRLKAELQTHAAANS